MNRRPAFTLVEMMLATVLAALLMAGLLTVASGLSRDQRRMQARTAGERPTIPIELLRKDLAGATAMLASADHGTIVLIGHNGLDPKTLSPTGRLAQVTYRLTGQRGAKSLVREQRLLDDVIGPRPWSEIVVLAARGFTLTPASNDAEPVKLGEDVAQRMQHVELAAKPAVSRIPSRMRLRLELVDRVIEEELTLR
jgi:prepilin-type N-terminal cleavage/methylation domain-containing protein